MRLALGLVTRAWLSPLAERDRWDPDQRYSYGLCYTIAAAVSSVDGNDANASFAHLGDVCASDGDCARLTDTSLCPLGILVPAIFLKPS